MIGPAWYTDPIGVIGFVGMKDTRPGVLTGFLG